MRGLLAVVCALGCVVGAGQAQASVAEAQQGVLASIEHMQAADHYPSRPAMSLAAAAPTSDAGAARTRLPAGALLFAFAFWSTIWLTRRSRGEGPVPTKTEQDVRSEARISDAPAAHGVMPSIGQVERRRGADRRPDEALERRS